MLGLLVRKELLTHLLSFRFVIALALQVSALLASFVVMAGQFEEAQRQHRANVTAARAANAFGGETADYFEYEHTYRRGSFVSRPPHAMGWLVRGPEGEVPSQIHVAVDYQRQVDKRLYRNPLKERLPAPDLLFLTRILLSLFALLFAFDAVCGEREEGTLKQALAGPVPRHLWLLGKWLGGMITLSTGFVLATAIGLLYVLLQEVPGASARHIRCRPGCFSSLHIAVFHPRYVDLHPRPAGGNCGRGFTAGLGRPDAGSARFGRRAGQGVGRVER